VTPLEQVTEFHRAFGCAVNQPWTVELGALRARLIAEECRELGEALLAGDPLKVARELADLAYVVLGTAVAFGIKTDKPDSWLTNFGFLCKACSELSGPLLFSDLATVAVKLPRVIHRIYGVADSEGIDLNVAITAVHIANMSKLGPDGKPIYRLDGKVLKPDHWSSPDLTLAVLGAR
jgi:predicted HAD superfamily Cof-like phosphohydrolase